MINTFEYKFLTDTWEGPKGAAYNACYEYLKETGHIKGFDKGSNLLVTDQGREAVQKYVDLYVDNG